jgi:hypothetical protein
LREAVAFFVGIFVQGCFVFAAGRLAEHRNRTPKAWMWVTVILGPMSLILLAVLPKNRRGISAPGSEANVKPSTSQTDHTELSGTTSMPWYCATEDSYLGPITLNAIRDLLKRGTVTQDTLVWNEKFGELWKPIRETEISDGTMRVPPPIRFVRPPVCEEQPELQSKRRRWLAPAIGCVVLFWFFGGFILVMNLLGYDTETMLSNSIPKCDSITAKKMAKEALQNGPLAKMVNTRVYEIQDARQIAYDNKADKRTCQATALLNSGRHDVSYTIEWMNKDKNKYWLEVEEAPF